MSKASRALQVGARVTTNFSGKVTEHEIIERIDATWGSSGVGFYVHQIVPGGTDEWLDADWFEPAPALEGETMRDQSKGGGDAAD